MPLFLFDSPRISDLQRDHALRLAARRFPEIAVEHRFGEQDGGGLDLWVCRASNEDQLTRWAVAAAASAMFAGECVTPAATRPGLW